MSSGVVRSTALRAGGACVRCRKGKTKCVYENGRAPCKNCAKGMHDCYLPSETMAHHHGQSPARHANPHRPPRDNLPAAGPSAATEARQPVVGSSAARHVQTGSDKYVVNFLSSRLIFPSCFHFSIIVSVLDRFPTSGFITTFIVAHQYCHQKIHPPTVSSSIASFLPDRVDRQTVILASLLCLVSWSDSCALSLLRLIARVAGCSHCTSPLAP